MKKSWERVRKSVQRGVEEWNVKNLLLMRNENFEERPQNMVKDSVSQLVWKVKKEGWMAEQQKTYV